MLGKPQVESKPGPIFLTGGQPHGDGDRSESRCRLLSVTIHSVLTASLPGGCCYALFTEEDIAAASHIVTEVGPGSESEDPFQGDANVQSQNPFPSQRGPTCRRLWATR